MSRNLFELSDPPSDAISSLRFAPDSRHLLAGSWDKHSYLYRVEDDGRNATLVKKYEHNAPILTVTYGVDSNVAYIGGLDCEVYSLNLDTSTETLLSSHNDAVCALVYIPQYQLLVSASWDSSIHIHRLSDPSLDTIRIPLPSKPVAMSVSPTKLVVAMASRTNFIFDLESSWGVLSSNTDLGSTDASSMPQVWQTRESSLKFMTRAVACMPNDAGYATSSIEGRVAVEWFDPSEESQARKYAFKCHRQETQTPEGDVVDVVYPVHALAFHPMHGTFASGGGDGVVALWDAIAKRRIRQYPKFGSSVAALHFSPDGSFLAMATSPGYEDGNDEVSEGSIGIYVRVMTGEEAKAKTAK